MAVKIRLRRTGATNDPSFRIVAADSRSPRDGRFLEKLGWYDPKLTGKNAEFNLERINYWVSQGAQVSDTVKSLMKAAKRPDTSEQPVAAVTEEAVVVDQEPAAEAVEEKPEAPEPLEIGEEEPAPEAAGEATAAEAAEEATAPEAAEEATAAEAAEEATAAEAAEEAAAVETGEEKPEK